MHTAALSLCGIKLKLLMNDKNKFVIKLMTKWFCLLDYNCVKY